MTLQTGQQIIAIYYLISQEVKAIRQLNLISSMKKILKVRVRLFKTAKSQGKEKQKYILIFETLEI